MKTQTVLIALLAVTADLASAGVVSPASAGTAPYVEVSAGGDHSCAVLPTGEVRCWGSNESGELGNGSETRTFPVPVSVTGIGDAVQLSAGSGHACAVLSTGAVKCWGRGLEGEPGSGQAVHWRVPVRISGIGRAVQVSGGWDYTCALLHRQVVTGSPRGGVKCWGRNKDGSLGNGTTDWSSVAVSVVGIHDAVQVSAGYEHACAVLATGAVKCWGPNKYGQLGDGTRHGSSVPVATLVTGGAEQVAAGGRHTCALLGDGTVVCWGDNLSGQLGDGTTGGYSRKPVGVEDLSGAIGISAGLDHTCALLEGGAVKCWGENGRGELGNHTTQDSSTPVFVSRIREVIQVEAGYAHTCALVVAGAKCWGSNSVGELGDGTYEDSSVPVDVVSGP